MIDFTRLLAQLGILYICFGYLEASCCTQTSKTPIVHRVGFSLLWEGLLASLWICKSNPTLFEAAHACARLTFNLEKTHSISTDSG